MTRKPSRRDRRRRSIAAMLIRTAPTPFDPDSCSPASTGTDVIACDDGAADGGTSGAAPAPAGAGEGEAPAGPSGAGPASTGGADAGHGSGVAGVLSGLPAHMQGPAAAASATAPAPPVPPAAPAAEQPPAAAPQTSDERVRLLEARVAELTAKQGQHAASLAQQRAADIDRVLGGLGVRAQYRKFAPADVDPTTDAGKAALEKWAEEHPHLVDHAAAPSTPDIDLAGFDTEPEVMGIGKEAFAAGLADVERFAARLSPRLH